MGNEGLSTGLTGLDNIINFPKTGVILVASGPGVGKTMMMTQMAIESIKTGSKIGFVSFESNSDFINARISSYYSNKNLLKECFSDSTGNFDYKKLKEECLGIKREEEFEILLKNFLFLQPSNTVSKMLLSLKETINKSATNIVFIDSLQLLNFGVSDPYGADRINLELIKDFAKANNILIVLGYQKLRNGGISESAKEIADIIIKIDNISRDKEFGELKISVIKNRPEDITGEIDCNINYGTGRFTD